MASSKTYQQRAVAILGLAVAAVATAGALFADRRGGIDEIGLVNPAYMQLHWRKMTYPVHGFFDSMFVHPPVHYAVVALFMRLGFTLYYAEAIPTFLMILLCVVLIVRSPLEARVKMGLLFGLAMGPAIFDKLTLETYGMRPEHHLAAAFLTGLVLLEWGRVDGWAPKKLFAGAMVIVFAAELQYYAWPAVLTVAVYAAVLLVSLGWKNGRRPLAALAGGALVIGVPYLVWFVLPRANEIRAFLHIIREGGTPGPAATHIETYHHWANMGLGDGLARPVFWSGVPMVVLSTLIFLGIHSTRTIALAVLPVQLFLLFFAWHKHAYYYFHEVQFYYAAILCLALTMAGRLLGRSSTRSAHAGVWYVAAILCGIHVWITGTTYKDLHWNLRPRVHEMEIARAAGREMLGPEARVGSRIGAWYSSGAAHWYPVAPDLFWDTFAENFNVKRYAADFDAIAEYGHMSYVTRNGRHENAASWYMNGSWQLGGFFFAEDNPELSYLLFRAARAGPVVGYGLKDGRMYRFAEEQAGGVEFVSLACHFSPQGRAAGWEAVTYLEASKKCPGCGRDALFSSLLFLPGATASAAGDSLISVVLPAGSIQTYLAAHGECRAIERVRGSISGVDQGVLIAKLRREDRPIRFYQQIIDMPGVPRVIGEKPAGGAMRLAEAIKLERMKLINEKAFMSSGPPWKVVTAPGMGAYATSIPIDAPADPMRGWVHLKVTVSKGKVGLGVLNRERRNFLTEPPQVRAGQLPVDIYISLPSTAGADEVIVRSAETDTASEVTLHEADLWVSKDAGRESATEFSWSGVRPGARHHSASPTSASSSRDR